VVGGETVTANDHERYNLAPYITSGDTTISINTLNPSNDDNIFLETFDVSGAAAINAPPPSVAEPASLGVLAAGLLAMTGLTFRRRSRNRGV
jgi:MYXO-CTERM domain-containing protein